MTLKLKLSADRKTSPLIEARPEARRGGEYLAVKEEVKVRNAFGLPSIETCPGHTSHCARHCYAYNMERLFTSTRNLVGSNFEVLESLDLEGKIQALIQLVAEYNTQADKKGIQNKSFRWHWSGDIYSLEYAQALYETMRKFPDIQFVTYTRSFGGLLNVLPVMMQKPLENFSLYLSVDLQNLGFAQQALRDYPFLPVAICGKDEDIPTIQDALEGLIGRSRVCPTDRPKGALPLTIVVDKDSQFYRQRLADVDREVLVDLLSKKEGKERVMGVGACQSCGTCGYNGKKPKSVIFPTRTH